LQSTQVGPFFDGSLHNSQVEEELQIEQTLGANVHGWHELVVGNDPFGHAFN
jgi:hypothetical protein